MTNLLMEIDQRMPVAFCARISVPGSFKGSCTRPGQLDMRFVFHSHNSMVERRNNQFISLKQVSIGVQTVKAGARESDFNSLKAVCCWHLNGPASYY